jgi:hypothetical protein
MAKKDPRLERLGLDGFNKPNRTLCPQALD